MFISHWIVIEIKHAKTVLISVHAPSVIAVTQLAFVEGSRWPPYNNRDFGNHIRIEL